LYVGYCITPGTRKATTPVKGYSTSTSLYAAINGGVYNPDIIMNNMIYNNGVTPPAYSTNPNYDSARDTSLRSAKHMLVFPSGQSIEVTS